MDINGYLKNLGRFILNSAEDYARKNNKPTRHPIKEIGTTIIEEIAKEDPIMETFEEPIRNEKPILRDSDKEFIKLYKQLTYRHNSWSAWSDFVTMFACSLSNPIDKEHFEERENLYLNIINKYSKDEQQIFPKLAAAVSVDNVVDEVNEKGYISINDPTCGAGATLIAGVHEVRKQLEKVNMNFQNYVLVVGQDIDFTVAMMCYIQLSLLGVAGYIKVGNSLTEPMTTGDTTENYWFTPMYFSTVWRTRRMLQKVDSITRKEEKNGNTTT